MALVFTDSFDHYATADILKKWTSITAGPGSTNTISAGNGARGSSCFRMNTTNQTDNLNLTLDPAPSGATFICGLRFKISTLELDGGTTESSSDVVCACRLGGTSHVWFRLLADGTVAAYRSTTLLGTSTFALASGTYYFLEFKVTISNTVGVVQFRRDGVLDATLNLTNQDTNNGAGTDTWNGLTLGPINVAGVTTNTDWDDLYLLDGSGSYNNDFLSDVRVDTIVPTAEGTTINGTPSTGTDNSALVDDATANGDTDYVTFAAVADKDTYVLANHPVGGSAIYGMQINMWARKEDAGVVGVKSIWRTGGSEYDGSEKVPPLTYRNLRQVYDRSPVDGTTAITTTEIDGAELGFKKSA